MKMKYGISVLAIAAVMLFVSFAYAKNPAVLIQEGLYAEETEGNLDKAIGIYEQVLGDTEIYERIRAKAALQLGMCYLKKGEEAKAAEYLNKAANDFPTQKVIADKAREQLGKIGKSTNAKGNLFGILGNDINAFIGSKYGEVCAEAGMKKLYANCIIYLVDNQFVLRGGSMGYVYNCTDKPIMERYRISSTTLPSIKFYNSFGEAMDVEIIPDENMTGYFNIYWNPKEPLEPGEFYNYASVVEGSLPLSRTEQGYELNMNNRFGNHCYEIFFLVVAEEITITDQSEEYTKMKNLDGWDIYWWKKEVPADTTNAVNVVLKKELIVIDDSLPIDTLFCGDERFTKEYIKSELGTPEREEEKSLDYRKKYGLDFFVDGFLKEIHINQGFAGKFENGLTMQSTTEDIFRLFGQPTETIQTEDLNTNRKQGVLYRREDGIGRIAYDQIVFWLKGDNINQIASGSVVLKGNKSVRLLKEESKVAYPPSEIVGEWESVDYVTSPEEFDPGRPQGELFMAYITFLPDGKTTSFCTWTEGLIHHEDGKVEAEYFIKKINDIEYLFYPWLSGDVTVRGEKPRYYVLKRAQSIPLEIHDLEPTEIVGKWESVDYVSSTDQFEPGKKKDPKAFSLKVISFLPDGKTTSFCTWTKGWIHNGKTKSEYYIKKINGEKYLFYPWLSGDVTERGEKPYYYVFKQYQSIAMEIHDLPPTEIVGEWESVDYVSSPDQFEPGKKQCQVEELFLKDISILPDGGTTSFCMWTKGWIRHRNGRTKAKYYIKRINDEKFLFYPWLSGDVTDGGMKPMYYVLKQK